MTGVPRSILAVVVLYNKPPELSATLRALRGIFESRPELLDPFVVLLWDNSPVALPMPDLPVAFLCRHAERNEGVSGAYNAAAGMARERGLPWLLLLDQDTEVTNTFLLAMAAHAEKCAEEENVAAVVPYLFAGALQLSPHYVRFGRQSPVPVAHHGREKREIYAANSGTLMRVAALEEIGGYSSDFWLDYSDLYVFHQFYLRGRFVYLAGDAQLQHEIAMLDYDARMTPERYHNFLAAEGAFHDCYKGRLENAIHLLRLLVRSLRQRRLKDPAFSRLTFAALLQRLRSGRKSRIEAWQAQNRERRG